MPKRHRKNKSTAFRLSSRSGTGRCTARLCGLPIKVGAPVAWWPVKRWNGRGQVECRTAYRATCHTASVRAGRALVGSDGRTPEQAQDAEADLEADMLRRVRGRRVRGGGEATPRHPPAAAHTLDADRARRNLRDATSPVRRQQMSEQGPRVRVRDGKGNPIPGLYRRDDKFSAGFQEGGRWRMVTLKATTVTEAKRERASLVVGLREGRIASADISTFAEVFADWQQGEPSASAPPITSVHLDRHLATVKGQRVQKISASDVARVLRSMRDDGYSGWTCSATYRILRAVFAHAERRGILTKNPTKGLTDGERPKQRNAKAIERLDSATLRKLIAAAPTERWRRGSHSRASEGFGSERFAR